MSTKPDQAQRQPPRRETEHEVFIVHGSGVVKSEQGDRSFAAGDTVFIPVNEPHCFVATTVVQFVCVIPSPNACAIG